MSVASTVIGILLAVLSAGFLSVGNIWQSRGVAQATANRGTGSQAMALLRTPIWRWGTVMFGGAIVLQMSSLAFAPITLVQPIGILALVFSVFINARISGLRPDPAVFKAVSITLVGVVAYVAVASQVMSQQKITDRELVLILCAHGAALVIAALVLFVNRGGARRAPIIYVLLAGMFSAFVASLGKTVIMRVEALFAGGHFSLDNGGALTISCLVSMGIASALSIYFTQTAYSCNPSDVVAAGLTVVDPGIAVLIGIVILQEASTAPAWSFFVIAAAGVVSMIGVFRLARAETRSEEAEIAAVASETDPPPPAVP